VLTSSVDGIQALADAVRDLLDEVDTACSRFREDSDLSRLNRSAGGWVDVSPLLMLALETAARVCRITEGAVDPTVGNAMRIIGYDRDFADLPANGIVRLRVQPTAGCGAIEVDSLSKRARIRRDVQIDLGATAKALAADLGAKVAFRAARCGVLISLGGDIALAGPAPDDGWPILVSEDHAAPLDGPGEVIALRAGAIATSSTTVRRWQQGGQSRHHIVDPKTGAPATGRWRTASVVASSCVDANAAATASIVMGESAVPWLRRHHLSVQLVASDGEVLRIGDWPAPVGVRA